MRRLAVFWYQNDKKLRIGTLLDNPRGPIVYEWDRDFLLTSIELSPIRFTKSPTVIEFKRELFGGLPGLFADCVPDGWGKLLLTRGLEKKGITTTAVSPLDYLAYIGDGGMGALAFAPEMRFPNKWAEGKVSLSELDRGIKPIMEGTPSDVLKTFIANGASPNGARPKILLKEVDGTFFSVHSPKKSGDEWLIKFKAAADPEGIGRLEYVYSQMALAAGLEMPETRLFTSGGKYFFGAKRFDRTPTGRLHVHTLSGMLHVSLGNFTIDYSHFAKVAQLLTSDIREVEKVIRLAAFNVLSCNQDDHAKNVAFLMHPNGVWGVAPAYDLTFYQNVNEEHKMMLGGQVRPTETDLLTFARSFGMTASKAKALLEQVKEGVFRFKTLSKELEVPKPLAKKVLTVIEQRLGRRKGIGARR